MLREDFQKFIKTIPNKVTIVAATKYVDVSTMEDLYKNGINNFGENRVDSFLNKYEYFIHNKDIKWHFIGHLQRNKAKEVINKIDYLHSLDSLKLADLIEKERETPLDTFIEVSINLEESKNGVPYYELEQFVSQILKYKKIHLVGLMMMAIKGSLNTEEQFNKLRELRDELETKFNIKIPYLSMGMSDDYLQAINMGATHIRLGRILYEV